MNLPKPFVVIVLSSMTLAHAVGGAPDTTPGQRDIRSQLDAQVQAWNAGNIPEFIQSYADDCVFVGKEMLQGKAALQQRYEKAYPSHAAMGTLTFANLAVRQLDQRVAIVTGEWHLDRNKTAGGPVGGIFSLVWQLRGGKWRIVLDHTT